MKQDYTLELVAENNFSILNRIVNVLNRRRIRNVLNRRRIRIKKLMAHENENDFRKGGAVLLLHTTSDAMEKVKHQLEKLIEVEYAIYTLGSNHYLELSERIVDVD